MHMYGMVVKQNQITSELCSVHSCMDKHFREFSGLLPETITFAPQKSSIYAQPIKGIFPGGGTQLYVNILLIPQIVYFAVQTGIVPRLRIIKTASFTLMIR